MFGIQYGESQEEGHFRRDSLATIYLNWRTRNRKTTVINGIVNLFAELNGLELDPTKYTQEIFPICWQRQLVGQQSE